MQAVIRHYLSPKKRQRWAEIALRMVNGSFPGESHDVRTWQQCAVLMSHARAAVGHIERLQVEMEERGWLLNQMGLYLKGRAA